MKLLLRNGASIAERNAEGQTALDIAKEKEHQLCCDLLEQGSDNKSALFENVNIDWDLDPWKVISLHKSLVGYFGCRMVMMLNADDIAYRYEYDNFGCYA